jgi:hypothetical protein
MAVGFLLPLRGLTSTAPLQQLNRSFFLPNPSQEVAHPIYSFEIWPNGNCANVGWQPLERSAAGETTCKEADYRAGPAANRGALHRRCNFGRWGRP